MDIAITVADGISVVAVVTRARTLSSGWGCHVARLCEREDTDTVCVKNVIMLNEYAMKPSLSNLLLSVYLIYELPTILQNFRFPSFFAQ